MHQNRFFSKGANKSGVEDQQERSGAIFKASI
jgi:hypothetical protein